MKRLFRRAAAGILAAGTLLALTAPPASAHAALTDASPKKDSTVSAPSEVVLTYSEAVRLPRVVVTDASDQQVHSGSPEAVGNKVTQALNPGLPNGKYEVAWRVVSSDGHPIQGTYTFTVEGAEEPEQPAAEPSAPESAAPAPAETQAASSEESGGSSGWLWIGLIALVLAGAGGAIAWFRRSSSNEG